MLKDLKKKCVIGYVGGSDLAKQKEQLGEDAATHLFDFGFSENGATAFKNGVQIGNEVTTKPSPLQITNHYTLPTNH